MAKSSGSLASWQMLGESVLLSSRMWVFGQNFLTSTPMSHALLSSKSTLLALFRLSRTEAVSLLRRRWPNLPSMLLKVAKERQMDVESVWLALECVANLVEDGCCSREFAKAFLEDKSEQYKRQYHSIALQYASELSGQLTPSLPTTLHSLSKLQNSSSNSARSAVHSTLDAAVLLGVPVILQATNEAAQVASLHLLDELARRQHRVEHRNLFRIRAEACADVKSLMGAYVCTCVPGQFEWRDGIVKRALKNGHWLVIEAFDQTSSDVGSYLSGLIDNRLDEESEISPEFRLFLVVSSSNTCLVSSSTKALKLAIEGYSESEICLEATQTFPLLKSVIPRFIACLKEGNLVTLNNVLNWCRRVITDQELRNDEKLKRSVLLRQAHQVVVASAQSEEQRELRLRAIENNFYVRSSDIETAVANVELDELKESNFFMTRQSFELLSFLKTSVRASQPVLLVGETGVGKTSAVQYLAQLENVDKLIVLNLSPQSDSSDLIGGFKPVNPSVFYEQMLGQFRVLLKQSFDSERNRMFMVKVADVFNRQRYTDLLKIIAHVGLKATKVEERVDVAEQWSKLVENCRLIADVLGTNDQGRNLFSFVIGPICQAMIDGHWVLLDEINLAETELLAVLDTLLAAIVTNNYYIEGNDQSIEVHSKFRLFAAMNPATDVGKRDLDPRLKSRFVQFNVTEPTNQSDLEKIVKGYLRHVPDSIVFNVVKFYRMARLLREKKLTNGQGGKPSFSLRTLCRALKMCMRNVEEMGLKRALLESMSASFLTQLDHNHSYALMLSLLHKHFYEADIFRPLASTFKAPHVVVEGFNIFCGPKAIVERPDFILTSSVRQNLKDVARIVAMSDTAILLQGDTSVGKTSLVRYLADVTGHHCIRINNHEHTELDEYIGAYCTSEEGKFVFIEGLVVKAMREGHWLILDELNLAPSEVLESLNRVLDENRELFINETQTLIKAHAEFRVFATQNPSHYGGRKMLSRAFRSRFIELHFDNLPPKELKVIVEHKCGIPAKLSSKMIETMCQLQIKRRSSAAFQGRSGFITLRDLFRWAIRYNRLHLTDENSQYNDKDNKSVINGEKVTKKEEKKRQKASELTFFDYDQHMLEEGYLVLSSRLRQEEETLVVQETLEKIFRRKLDLEKLFSLNNPTATLEEEMHLLRTCSTENDLVWTGAATRMAALTLHSFKYREPVLLVGSTGLGKTSICLAVAKMLKLDVHTISCHLNSDASDFLGALRPNRSDDNTNRLFEWVDGPLLEAMTKGQVLMIDEIALAEDSVLERLNSVLETDRTLVVAERPRDHLVVANEDFRLVATMNPGGDYGKRELSVALRNRFNEIWCPQNLSKEELKQIFLGGLINDGSNEEEIMKEAEDEDKMDTTETGSNNDDLAQVMTDFVIWASSNIEDFHFSLRDVRNWASFIARARTKCNIGGEEALLHGAKLVFFDGFESNKNNELVNKYKAFFSKALDNKEELVVDDKAIVAKSAVMNIEKEESGKDDATIRMGPFKLQSNKSQFLLSSTSSFLLDSPSGRVNVLKVLRGLVITKPVLLEGPPGIGKTALISTLAQTSNNKLIRINLSEETEVSDLFGCDLPLSDSENFSKFGWQDGPFLRALKEGQWILLDELNLASQTVLEGLNACFDHRGEIYVPELNRCFHIDNRHSRIFATQNPANQGHGRKSLPKSFLNRFTRIQLDQLHPDDAVAILDHKFNKNNDNKCLPLPLLKAMVKCVAELDDAVNKRREFGCSGFSFNLRDLIRWTEAVVNRNKCIDEDNCEDNNDSNEDELVYSIVTAGRLVIAERFRSVSAKLQAFEMIRAKFGDVKFDANYMNSIPEFEMSSKSLRIGQCRLQRSAKRPLMKQNLIILTEQLNVLEHLMLCVHHNWIPVLVGSKGVGKTAVLDILASLLGQNHCTLSLNSSTDASELLGSFEQINEEQRNLNMIKTVIKKLDEVVNDEKNFDTIAELISIRERINQVLKRDNDRREITEKDTNGSKRIIKSDLEQLITDLHDEMTRLESKAKPSTIKFMEELKTFLIDLANLSRINNNSFVWCDSQLVKAVIEGRWLVLDNANFCSVSMLDRLNSLLEPEGTLVISEQGAHEGEMRIVRPHPNFRIFLTVDPANGELSAAMRNRCVELYMTSPLSPNVISKLLRNDLHNIVGCNAKMLSKLLSTSSFSSLHQVRSFAANLTMMLEAGHGLDAHTVDLIKKCGVLDDSNYKNNSIKLSESHVAPVQQLSNYSPIVVPHLQCQLILLLMRSRNVNPLLCVHAFMEMATDEDVDTRLKMVKDNLVKDEKLLNCLENILKEKSKMSSRLLCRLTEAQISSIDSDLSRKSHQLIEALNDFSNESNNKWLNVFRVCVLSMGLKELLIAQKTLKLQLGVTWANICDVFANTEQLKPFLERVEHIMETNSTVSTMQRSVLNFSKNFRPDTNIKIVKVLNEYNEEDIYECLDPKTFLKKTLLKRKRLKGDSKIDQENQNEGQSKTTGLKMLQILIEDLGSTTNWLQILSNNNHQHLTKTSVMMPVRQLRQLSQMRQQFLKSHVTKALLEAHQRRMSTLTTSILEGKQMRKTSTDTFSDLLSKLLNMRQEVSVVDFKHFLKCLKCLIINSEVIVENEKKNSSAIWKNSSNMNDNEMEVRKVLDSSLQWLESKAQRDQQWSLLHRLLKDNETNAKFSNSKQVHYWNESVHRVIRGFALFHAMRNVAQMDVLRVWSATKDFLVFEADMVAKTELATFTMATLNIEDETLLLKDNKRHSLLRELQKEMKERAASLILPQWERCESRDELVKVVEDLAQTDLALDTFIDILVKLHLRDKSQELKLRLNSITTNLAVDIDMLNKKFVSHQETTDFILLGLAEIMRGLMDLSTFDYDQTNLDDIVSAIHSTVVDQQPSFMDMNYSEGRVHRGQLRLPLQSRLDEDSVLDILHLQTKETKSTLPNSLTMADMEQKWVDNCDLMRNTLTTLAENQSARKSSKSESMKEQKSSLDMLNTLLTQEMSQCSATNTLRIASKLLNCSESQWLRSKPFLITFRRVLENSKLKMDELLNKYPSEFKLIEAKTIIGKILEHRITDSRQSFQYNMEQLVLLMEDWNMRAKKNLKLEETDCFKAILEKWNKIDYDAMITITKGLRSYFTSLLPAMSSVLLLIITKVLETRGQATHLKGIYINLAVNIFLFSSCSLEHKERIAALNNLAEVLGKEHSASTLIRRSLNYFDLFDLDTKAKQIVNNAQSIVTDMKRSLKELAEKKEKGIKRESEEKIMKKFYTNILEVLSKPFEQKTMKTIDTNVFDETTFQVLEETKKLVLKKSLREALDAFKALSRLKSMNKDLSETETANTEDVASMSNALETMMSQLSSSGLTSKQRYPMQKLLESHFKALATFFSHRKGNMYDVGLIKALSMVEVRNKPLMAVMGQMELMIDVMAQFCTQQKTYLSKGFLERATGFSRAIIVDLMHLEHVVNKIGDISDEALKHFGSFEPKKDIWLKVKLLRKECVVKLKEAKRIDDIHIDTVINALGDHKENLDVVSKALKKLSDTELRPETAAIINDINQKVIKIKQLEEQFSQRTNLSTKVKKRLQESFDANTKKCSKESKKLLLNLNQALQEEPFSWQLMRQVTEQLEVFINNTKVGLEVRDVIVICEHFSLDQRTFDELSSKFSKNLFNWQQVLKTVLNWTQKFMLSHTRFVFRLMQVLSLFVSYDFVENNDDGEEEEQKEGCGLGDGADGDSKAINNEEITDDLLENVDLDNNDNKENNADKEDDAYDCPRERIEGDNERMDEEEGKDDNDDEKDEDEDEDMPDVERAEGEVGLEEDDEIKPDNKEDDSDESDDDEENGENDQDEKVDRPEDDENELRKREKDEDAMSPEVQTGDTEHEEHDEQIDDLGDMDDDQNLDNDENDEDMDQQQEDDIERKPDFESSSSSEGEEDDVSSTEDPTEVQAMEDDVGEENNKDEAKEEAKLEETKPDDSEGQHGGNTEDVAMEEEMDDQNQQHDKALKQEQKDKSGKANAVENNENDKEENEGDDGQDNQEEREAAKVQHAIDQAERLTLVNKNESTMDKDESNVYAHTEQQRGEDAPQTKLALDTIKTFDDKDEAKDNKKEEEDEKMDKEDTKEETSNEDKTVNNEDIKDTLVYKGLDAVVKQAEMVSRGDLISAAKPSFNESNDMNEDMEMLNEVDTDIDADSQAKWLSLCQSTSAMTSRLSEQLRLILEPTKRTRFRGDYKSGKRLNMRRIIGYLASDMRKDKIWMRRQKPSKRDCSIVVAVDDSSSMQENCVQQLTFEALATLCNALSKVDAGELGVVRFGLDAHVVCQLRHVFGPREGSRIVSSFGFEQSETRIVDMLGVCRSMLSRKQGKKIVFVLSDGRGVFHEGKERVLEAIRAMEDIVVVYIIIESPNSAESVLDIRTTMFDPHTKKFLGMQSYMEHFPFELYIVLRHLNNLPQVLADALRQWFELVMD